MAQKSKKNLTDEKFLDKNWKAFWRERTFDNEI